MRVKCRSNQPRSPRPHPGPRPRSAALPHGPGSRRGRDGARGGEDGDGAFRTFPEPEGLPEPLPEPAREELRLEAVMAALSDPLRLYVVRKLLLEADRIDHPGGWFGLDRPKSSLTHHFRALREAGLIRQRQYGLSRGNQVRVEDLEARFPGLLQLIADWRPNPDNRSVSPS